MTHVQNSQFSDTIIFSFYHNLKFFSLDVFELAPPLISPCRFGKKKEEKKEAKAAQQKSDLLSDHELQRMKDERERWV